MFLLRDRNTLTLPQNRSLIHVFYKYIQTYCFLSNLDLIKVVILVLGSIIILKSQNGINNLNCKSDHA